MNNIYFSNVSTIGNLYLEYVFYEFENEPILFLCKDEMDNIYFCLCSDIRYGQKWIITKCTMDILRKAIEQKIDIVSVFSHQNKCVVINMDINGNENSFQKDIKDIDPLDLPKKETYIKCDKIEVKNFLEKIENIYTSVYNCLYKVNENEKFHYSGIIENEYAELYGEAA